MATVENCTAALKSADCNCRTAEKQCDGYMKSSLATKEHLLKCTANNLTLLEL